MSQGSLHAGSGKRLVCRLPQRVRWVEFGPHFIPSARFKPTPSGMNRTLDPQPRVAAARRTLGYERMSLQDMAGIEVVFGRMAEGALSWTGIWRPRFHHLNRQ